MRLANVKDIPKTKMWISGLRKVRQVFGVPIVAIERHFRKNRFAIRGERIQFKSWLKKSQESWEDYDVKYYEQIVEEMTDDNMNAYSHRIRLSIS